MTDRLTPERLATIRNNHARDLRLGDEYRLQADNEDLRDLLGEIDRLTAENEQLADFDALGQRGSALQAERDEAVRRWHDEHRAARDAGAERDVWKGRVTGLQAERDRLWMLLEIERGLTSTARLHAEALKGATAFQLHADGETPAGLHADRVADGLLRALGPQRPHAAPQRSAPGPWDGFAGTEAAEATETAQRPAEGFEPDGRLYVNGPPCRHDRTWLVETEAGWQCMVCGPAQAAESLPVPIRRRTPADRLAYLTAQRDDAIARGLPAELIDDMIADAQAEITPEEEATLTVLTVTSGPCSGLSVPLDANPVTAGRAPSCTLTFDDDYASPHHARFERSPSGTWTVQDLGSTNGTYLGRVRIVGPAPVSAGSVVRIGRTTLEVRQHVAQSPIAPEDEGIATSDVTAQVAADEPVIWRTPETWCAIYGIDIRDPDGWRGPDAPAWEQPITLDEFRKRLASSTVVNVAAAYDTITRALAKPERADNESEQK